MRLAQIDIYIHNIQHTNAFTECNGRRLAERVPSVADEQNDNNKKRVVLGEKWVDVYNVDVCVCIVLRLHQLLLLLLLLLLWRVGCWLAYGRK